MRVQRQRQCPRNSSISRLVVLAVHDYPEAVAARVEDSGAGADARMAERTSPEAAGVVQK
jgi:hypothetical protein